MTLDEALEKALIGYKRYYNIKREDATPPFEAEAVFNSHNEQYFLVKAAKVADIDSNEYVFFKIKDHITLNDVCEYDKIAWEEGLSRIIPSASHRNSDVTLVLIADRFDQDAYEAIKKMKHYKSYRLGFQGWSNYRLVAVELLLKRVVYNRQGQSLKKLFGNIFK